ncbi:unnamed protein product [Prunus brigantina]
MERLTSGMKKFGYQQPDTDHTLFIKHRAGKYVMNLLADNGMLDCKPADTPIVENRKLGVYMDQQSTFEITNNPIQLDRTKYVEVDRHFIKEKLEYKLIYIPFVPSSEQVADMLTHALSKS